MGIAADCTKNSRQPEANTKDPKKPAITDRTNTSRQATARVEARSEVIANAKPERVTAYEKPEGVGSAVDPQDAKPIASKIDSACSDMAAG